MTAQIADAVLAWVAVCDIFIGVAAAAAYTSVQSSLQKIKKSGDTLAVELRPTTDILATVAQRQNRPFCVGFAAESQDVTRLAVEKGKTQATAPDRGDLAQGALGNSDSQVTLLNDDGIHLLPKMDKLALARS